MGRLILSQSRNATKKEECAASNPLKPLQDKCAPSKQCSSVYRPQNHLLQRCLMELWQVSDLHEVRFVEESQSHIVALRGTLGMCQPTRSCTSCIEYSQLVRDQCLMHVRSQEPPLKSLSSVTSLYSRGKSVVGRVSRSSTACLSFRL